MSFTNRPQDQYIEVLFSKDLKAQDLQTLKTNLEKQSIHLNYDYLKFTPEGKLCAIKYAVEFKKVRGADEAKDMSRELGFILNTDTNPKAHYGIIVGFKDQIENRRSILENEVTGLVR